MKKPLCTLEGHRFSTLYVHIDQIGRRQVCFIESQS
jgi:hypothetical protein